MLVSSFGVEALSLLAVVRKCQPFIVKTKEVTEESSSVACIFIAMR